MRFTHSSVLLAVAAAMATLACDSSMSHPSTSALQVVAKEPRGGAPVAAASPYVTGNDDGSNPTAPDGGPLSPENPACANHSGDPGTCWGEWLKEPGNVDFKPVPRGALGAGPWPTTDTWTMGAAQGLSGPILYVGLDTGENIYAVNATSLFIRRPGEAKFEEYDQNTNGLKNYPFLSVAGQAPGVAYVGHVGITPPSEFNTPPTDPPALLESGGIDKVVLTPTGIKVTSYWTHNSNSPSGSYSHDRTLYNLFVPRRGPAAGELYSSSEHCITRRLDDTHYASHRHIEVDYGGSAHYGMARAVTVTDDGYMWYGSDYEFGTLAWQPRLYEWYFDNSWIMPTNAYGTPEQQDWYRGIGVASNGDVWAAAYGNGIAHLSNVDLTHKHADLSTITPPDLNMNHLIVDLDDSVWIATDSGLYRYVPTTQTWTSYPAAGTNLQHIFLDDTVTPRALYVGNNDGIWVYRGQ